MKIRNVGLIFIACVLSLATLMATPLIAFADEADELDSESETVTPKIEVQKDGWLIISFAGKVRDKASAARELDAYLARALDEMNSSSERTEGGPLRSGYNYMHLDQEKDFGDSYVRAWYGTSCSWSSSPASFSGSSSNAWYGTSPSYTCDVIAVGHALWPAGLEGWINDVPSGWTNNGSSCCSPNYFAYDDWYLGTAWSGLTASYTSQIEMHQVTESAFDFGESGDVGCYLYDYMRYGDSG